MRADPSVTGRLGGIASAEVRWVRIAAAVAHGHPSPYRRGHREMCCHGHVLSGDNLRIRRDGGRDCRRCEWLRKRGG